MNCCYIKLTNKEKLTVNRHRFFKQLTKMFLNLALMSPRGKLQEINKLIMNYVLKYNQLTLKPKKVQMQMINSKKSKNIKKVSK
jgi:hypothetical protein